MPSLYNNKNKQPIKGKIQYVGKIQVSKRDVQASFPTKINETDVGYDIALIGRDGGRTEDNAGEVNVFRTGLILIPPQNHFLELVENKTLNRCGYMLVGNRIVEPNNKVTIIEKSKPSK